MNLFSRQLRNVRLFLDRARAAKPYKSMPMQVFDAIYHKIAINTALRDYHQYEFYKPGQTLAEKSRYVGLTNSRYWPYENNDPKFSVALSDKYIQKSLLIGFGLPTPELLGTAGRHFDITDEISLSRFLSTCSDDIVIKPVSSSGGDRILVLTHVAGSITCSGEKISVDELWAHLRVNWERGFLIEKKVRNTNEIDILYPDSLNTFRVVTIKTRDGTWHSPACALKLGRGGSNVDNLAAGGLQISFDSSGTSCSAYDHIAHKEITHHPDTKAALVGIKLDCYRDVINLGLRASRKFGFLGTIGWDIAMTDRGAMIIEGNTLWAPKFQIPIGGFITDEIAKGLTPRSMFSGFRRD